MLKQEPDTLYVVYPPWAEGSYDFSWKELDTVLSQARESKKLSDREREICDTPTDGGPPYRLLDGAFGGGIVVRSPARPWVAGTLLNASAGGLSKPDDMRSLEKEFTTPVCYIELHTGLGGLLRSGRTSRNHLCRIGVEHVPSVSPTVYWVLEFAGDKLPSIEAPARAAAMSFGFSVRPVTPPEQLRSGWSASQEPVVRQWFEIDSDASAGLHLAVLIYTAFHLRTANRSLRWGILIADIEGKPSILGRTEVAKQGSRS